MHQFFVSSKNISPGGISVTDTKILHHIRDVLRLKPGKEVILVDEEQNRYLTSIEEIGPKQISFRIIKKDAPPVKKEIYLAIACAIPKHSKFDDIVDKLTQLGVDRIIPLKTERMVVKLYREKEFSRHERMLKIALSASGQSKRDFPTLVDLPKTIEEVLDEAEGFDLKLIPTLEGKRESLKSILLKYNPKRILIFIGPEGDFSDREVELAKNKGCVPVTLGSNVLRVETAALCVASFIKLYENS